MKPPPDADQKGQVRVKEGYNIQRRTAERIGIDGKTERPSSKVTHISVGKSDANPDVKYEDVLDMKIKSKSAKGPHVHEEVSRASQSLVRQGNNSATNTENQQHQHKIKSASKTSVISEDSARGSKLHSSSLVLNQHEGDNDLNGIVLAPRSSPVNPPVHSVSARLDSSSSSSNVAGGSSTPKKPSAKSSGQSRPPPAKPVLHKTSAAAGSSITKNNSGEEPEFIHFSQQLSINRESVSQAEPKTRVSSAGSRQQSAAAIQSVTEHNKPPPKDVKFKEEVEIAEVMGESGDEDPGRYAFNIPTAEEDYPQSP